MINIMLVCNAGMSTSMLMNKMIEAAKQQGIEAAIWMQNSTKSGKRRM